MQVDKTGLIISLVARASQFMSGIGIPIISFILYGTSSRRPDCYFADIPSPCLLKHLIKVEGGCSEQPPARVLPYSAAPPSPFSRRFNGDEDGGAV